MSDAKKIFANNLHALMESNNLTKQDIYYLFYITDMEYDEIFERKTLPSIQTAKHIAEFAGCSVHDLFHRELQEAK